MFQHHLVRNGLGSVVFWEDWQTTQVQVGGGSIQVWGRWIGKLNILQKYANDILSHWYSVIHLQKCNRFRVCQSFLSTVYMSIIQYICMNNIILSNYAMVSIGVVSCLHISISIKEMDIITRYYISCESYILFRLCCAIYIWYHFDIPAV